MTPQELTEAAQRASERYVLFLNSLRGVLSQALRSDPSDMRARTALREACLESARAFLRTEIGIIEQEVERSAEEETVRLNSTISPDSSDAELSPLAQDIVETAQDRLETELRAQIERDIMQVLLKHKDFQIEVHMLADIERISADGAKFKVLMRGEDQVRFYFRDRMGRKLQSQKFIRTVWRDALLQTGNEAFLIAAAKSGFDTVVVDHPDRQSSANGVEIAINPEFEGEVSYADVRDSIFHPNSQAVLRLP